MRLVVRTIGIARAAATVTLANMAYNMKRWGWLARRGLSRLTPQQGEGAKSARTPAEK